MLYMICQKVQHEMSDLGSLFPPALISRGFKQQRSDSRDSPFPVIISSSDVLGFPSPTPAPAGVGGLFSTEALQNSWLCPCCGDGNNRDLAVIAA